MSEIDLQDAILRLSIALQRLSAHHEADADAQLQDLTGQLRGLLNAQDLTATNRRDVESLIGQANDIIGGGYSKLATSVDAQGLVVTVAEKTTEAMDLILAAQVAKPSAAILQGIAKNVLIEGIPSAAWWKKQGDDLSLKFAGAVRQGIVNGETQQQIVQRVVGNARTGEPGIMGISRRHARALVHTSVMSAANTARLASYRAASKHIGGVRWLATLDGHTCPRCMALDGESWDLDGNKLPGTKIDFMAPPIHFADRCVLSPIAKTDALGDEMNAAFDAMSERASKDGPIKATSFDDFLKRQSPEFIDKMLGKDRADMFRAGQITVKDLVSQSGRPLTLDELRALHGGDLVTEAATVAVEDTSKAVVEKVAEKAATWEFNPIDAAITDETVSVVSRLAVQKELTKELTEAAADSRYSAIPEFRGVTASQFGKASLPNIFSDEAASTIAALKPELDAMADRFGIPRLRGMRSITSAHANMGDGILGMNANQFNAFAARVGNAGARVAELTKREADLKAQLQSLKVEVDASREALRAISGQTSDWLTAYDRHKAAVDAYNKLLPGYDKIRKELAVAENLDRKGVATWKVGDDYRARPTLTTDYFEGINKARAVLYHEFGHHVHQTLNKVGRSQRQYDQPLEREIFTLFHSHTPARGSKLSGDVSAFFARQASQYATTNPVEWFAENFALYMMDRKDLVDPDVQQLIERVLHDTL